MYTLDRTCVDRADSAGPGTAPDRYHILARHRQMSPWHFTATPIIAMRAARTEYVFVRTHLVEPWISMVEHNTKCYNTKQIYTARIAIMGVAVKCHGDICR